MSLTSRVFVRLLSVFNVIGLNIPLSAIQRIPGSSSASVERVSLLIECNKSRALSLT